MRYRFHTLSAAFYVIDTEKMTWERHTPQPQTPEKIIGLEETSGPLIEEPVILIGERGVLQMGRGLENTIFTTPVQRIELLDP